MKLYHRYSKLSYRKIRPKRFDNFLKWGLSLKPGDIINDCTAFNKVVREIIPDYFTSKKGWAIYDVEIIMEPYGGSCSLVHCGVEPAIPRDVLEARYLASYDGQNAIDYFINWFGGPEKEETKKHIAVMAKRIEAIKNGGHFLDENGVMIPEFSFSNWNG